jgi:periplasmic protein TonB
VEVSYLVWTDGSVRDCEIERSSGSRILDRATCDLITRRFRFWPSRDERGRPVPAVILESHSWVLDIEPVQRRRR